MTLALYSGLSGISVHQKMLDITSNNITNLNTIGFKKSLAKFNENNYQTLKKSSAPTDVIGGINPSQIGNGVKISNISNDFSQGTLKETGNGLDMAISGEGFFVLDNGQTDAYSRVGNFSLDKNNYLVEQSNGYKVQSVNGDIIINKDEPLPPKSTAEITMRGNLSSSHEYPGADPVKTSISVLDGQGNSHKLDLELTRTTPFTWDMNVLLPDGDGVITDGLVQNITFGENGTFQGVAGIGNGDNNVTITFDGFITPQNITFDLGEIDGFNGLTQLGGDSNASAIDHDGYEVGYINSLSVQSDGTIVGKYSNGESKNLAELQIATFVNSEGLEKINDGFFISTSNSGQPILGKALSGRAGAIISGSLEASNVDVSFEITQMMVAQRGFQISSKVVSIANDTLGEVVNLIR